MSAPEHPALGALNAASRDLPGCWALFDAFRAARADYGDWPQHVYCPSDFARTVVDPDGKFDDGIIDTIVRLNALSAWRPTQGIYRFDPDLMSELLRSPIAGDLPCALLSRLPAWGVYVELGEMGALCDPKCHGFFANFGYHSSREAEDFRLTMLLRDGRIAPLIIPLGPWSIADAFERYFDMSATITAQHPAVDADTKERMARWCEKGSWRAFLSWAEPCLSLILYLCSDAADYTRPPAPRPVRTRRHGERLFPPPAPTTWDVGLRIGAALRRAAAEPKDHQGGTHASPRPHIRAAHWHLFWRGPRDGERTPDVRWLPPTGVKMALGDDTPAVVRPVTRDPETFVS